MKGFCSVHGVCAKSWKNHMPSGKSCWADLDTRQCGLAPLFTKKAFHAGMINGGFKPPSSFMLTGRLSRTSQVSRLSSRSTPLTEISCCADRCLLSLSTMKLQELVTPALSALESSPVFCPTRLSHWQTRLFHLQRPVPMLLFLAFLKHQYFQLLVLFCLFVSVI